MSAFLKYILPNLQFPANGMTAAEAREANDVLKLKPKPGKPNKGNVTKDKTSDVAILAPEGVSRTEKGSR